MNMKLIEKSLKDFIAEIASPSPAPGGGSVAAAAGAMGTALVRMVGHLSVNKKKFLALPAEAQAEFRETAEKTDEIRECLLRLVDEDTESFNRILEAHGLPKSTEAEIAVRNDKIREATLGAIRTPLETASLVKNVLLNLEVILQYGNRNCLSDLGVGALLLFSALEGALLNVETNLAEIGDSEIVLGYRAKCAEFLTEGEAAERRILAEVHRRIEE